MEKGIKKVSQQKVIKRNSAGIKIHEFLVTPCFMNLDYHCKHEE